MDKCYNCRYQEKWGCQGGCITFSILKNCKNDHIEQQTDVEKISNSQQIPISLAQTVTINRYDIPYKTYVLKNTVTNTEIEINESLRNFIERFDGQKTIREALDMFPLMENLSNQPNPIDTFERTVMRENINNLMIGLLKQGFFTSRTS